MAADNLETVRCMGTLYMTNKKDEFDLELTPLLAGTKAIGYLDCVNVLMINHEYIQNTYFVKEQVPGTVQVGYLF